MLPSRLEIQGSPLFLVQLLFHTKTLLCFSMSEKRDEARTCARRSETGFPERLFPRTL